MIHSAEPVRHVSFSFQPDNPSHPLGPEVYSQLAYIVVAEYSSTLYLHLVQHCTQQIIIVRPVQSTAVQWYVQYWYQRRTSTGTAVGAH